MASVEQLKQQGNELFTAGDFDKALKLYSQAITLAPENHVLYSNRAAAHAKSNNHSAALEDAEKCLQLNPSFAKGYLRKSAALISLSRPGHAEGALRDGMAKCGGDREALEHALNDIIKEDGDQSQMRGFLPGTPAQDLRQWQSHQGTMMHTAPMIAALPCPAFRHAFLGNLREFLAAFDPGQHISLRGWELRLPLVSAVVAGAQRVQLVAGYKTGDAHVAILEHVCQAGARVDARDITGWTAFLHATAHHARHDLARILLEHGASPTPVDRFGCTPLFPAVMAGHEANVRFLLESGSSPDVKDVHGTSLVHTARIYPAIQAMLHKQMDINQKNKGVLKGEACCNCGQTGATKRCSVCRVALYCNRTCQRAHWKMHKRDCEQQEAQLLRVQLSDCGDGQFGTIIPTAQAIGVMLHAMGVREEAPEFTPDTFCPTAAAKAAQRGTASNFIVKIQVPMDRIPGMPNQMLVYNKDRTFKATIACGGSEPARKLERIIRQKGISALKGYFLAYMDGKELVVVANKLLPAQPW